MIWLTWRQFRIQAALGLVVLALAVACFATTGRGLADLARSTGLASCASGCSAAAQAFSDQAMSGLTGMLYKAGLAVLFLAPAIIGIFWGAPLVAREFEQGTHRLIWNQSVSRGRWLAVKLAGGAVAAIGLTGLVSLAVTWWAADIDRTGEPRLVPWVFAARGVVPMGYAVLAFVLGATAGVLVRRTVPAMAITLVLVAAAQVAGPFLLRPHLSSPDTYTQPLTTQAVDSFMIHNGKTVTISGHVPIDGIWVLHNDAITASGAVFHGPADPSVCGPTAFNPQGCLQSVVDRQLRLRAVYLPADRFWALQWRELAVLLAASLALSAGCLWWIRRRTS